MFLYTAAGWLFPTCAALDSTPVGGEYGGRCGKGKEKEKIHPLPAVLHNRRKTSQGCLPWDPVSFRHPHCGTASGFVLFAPDINILCDCHEKYRIKMKIFQKMQVPTFVWTTPRSFCGKLCIWHWDTMCFALKISNVFEENRQKVTSVPTHKKAVLLSRRTAKGVWFIKKNADWTQSKPSLQVHLLVRCQRLLYAQEPT